MEPTRTMLIPALLAAVVFSAIAVGPASVSAAVPGDVVEREVAGGAIVLHHAERFEKAADKLEARAGDTWVKLDYRLDLGEAPVIDAWLLSDLDDYFTWHGAPTLAPTWAVGLSLTDRHTVLVRHGLGPDRQVVDIETTFDHELAHVAIDVARKGKPVPRWFNEGFASWSAGEWSLERAELVSRSAAQGLLLPMQEIEKTFPDHQLSTSLAYAQSHHFVQHMATRYGDDVFAKIVAHIAEGETFSVAFTYATGDDFEAVEYEWRSALMENTSPLSNLVDGTWLFFGASLMFLLAWYVRRKKSRAKFEHLDDDVYGWDYDPSRYRLPGQDVQVARQ